MEIEDLKDVKIEKPKKNKQKNYQKRKNKKKYHLVILI